MYKTRSLEFRTVFETLADGRKQSVGQERYWKEIVLPDAARELFPEVIEELGNDKQYVIAKLDELNKELNNETLLDLIRNFSAYTICRKACNFSGTKVSSDEDARKCIGISDEEIKSHLFKGKWAVVTRSFMPPQGTPWKRFGSRTYCWVVPMAEAFEHRGRRIEWGGDTTPFNSRKEALAFLYKG
jgi:hypothetical protein